MRKPLRKRVTMQVTVSVPRWMSAAQARREVRTLVNEQCNFLSSGPDFEEVDETTIRAIAVGAAPVRPRR